VYVWYLYIINTAISIDRSFAALNNVNCTIVQSFEPYILEICEHPATNAKFVNVATVFNYQDLVSYHRCILCEIFVKLTSSQAAFHINSVILHGHVLC
jgi:hypothetical protein